MQSVHKILMGNTIFIMLMVLVTILIITAIYSISYTFNANATPFEWNTNIFVPQTAIAIPLGSDMVLGDVNHNGIVDCIYTRAGTTMTRQFGTTCITPITIENLGGFVDVGTMHYNRLLTTSSRGSGAITCDGVGNQYDVTTGMSIKRTYRATALLLASSASILGMIT